MAITAKVILNSKTVSASNTTLNFHADYADGANKEWASATPSLTLTMSVTSQLGEKFNPGDKFTLIFDPQ